jgi:thiol-disulfide isomerase/thioredoxin
MDKNSETRHHGWVDENLAILNPGDEWHPDVCDGLLRLRKSQVRGSWFSKRWVLAATGAVVVCLCLMVLPSPKVLAHRCLECSVAVWQKLLPSAPVQANLKPPSGRTLAPDFNLKDANGRDVKLTDLKGKVVLVNFWATWCHGCQTEIPWFIEFQKEYADGGLVVVGISMDDDGWKSVRPWLKVKKVNYPIVIGNEGLGKQYGLDGMPLTALVDREGRLADVHPGLVDKTATQQKIRALLQEGFKDSAN